jgi:Protein of unknown function (DUF3606)
MRISKHNSVAQDQNRALITEDHELCSFLEEKLGVTKQEVLVALRAVGDNQEDVERYLAAQKWKK